MVITDYIMLLHKRASIKPGSTGREIAYKLMSTGLPGLPVVNESDEVIGVVTAFDLLGNIREGVDLSEIAAEKIMSKEPKTADMKTSAEELIEIMLENNFTMIPVVKDRKLVGIIDRTSLLNAYVEPVLHRYFGEHK
ncbi:MAG: CBS domain-containing protein [Nitrospirae bacterium]|nr:CBS domain-containing protein [Nitrospirota bacterium]